MTIPSEMIKAIANDSKVRIDRIVTNYEQLEKENAEQKEQLTQAKELLHKYYELTETTLLHHKIDTESSVKIQVKTEQFLEK